MQFLSFWTALRAAALRPGRLSALAAGVALLLAFPGLGRAQPGGPLRPNDARSKRARLDYFFAQRRYPFAQIPADAYMRAAEAAFGAGGRPSLAAATAASTWRPLGPLGITAAGGPWSGRVTSVVVHPTNSNVIYVGAAGGGVWKTADGGVSWTPLTDGECSTAMGAMAIDPVNPNIIYAGTGEGSFSADSYYGCGVLMSTNGGASWAQVGGAVFQVPPALGTDLGGSVTFSRIVIDPRTAGSTTGTTLYAATEVGLFKSTNSGATWATLDPIPGRQFTPATDLVIDPKNPSVLYAAMYDCCFAQSPGIYKSTNGGASWTKLAGGLPGPAVGRIELAMAPSATNTLYAAIEDIGQGDLLGIFRTTDAGATWTRQAATGADCATQCWYAPALAVDPTNANVVYFGGVTLGRSTDAAQTFTDVTGSMHEDFHAIAFDPQKPSTLYTGTDGGVYRGTNGGTSWASLNAGLAITQFYPGIAIDPTNASHILGGTQGTGTVEYFGNPVWTLATGLNGGYTLFNYKAPGTVFAEDEWVPNSGFSGPQRRDNTGPFQLKASGIVAADRGSFIPPMAIDPVNPQVLYFGTSQLYRSLNNAEQWAPVSPDLTRGIGTITAIAVAPSDTLTIYVGASDGNLQVTSNYGATWTVATVGLPNRWLTGLAVDSLDARIAYATFSGFNTGHVFRTTDRGVTWRDISGNLPNVPANAVLMVPRSTNLFVATDFGVYRSGLAGGVWSQVTGLPNSPVVDLAYHAKTQQLVAATHGRGMFSMGLAGVLRGDVSSDGNVGAVDAQAILAAVVGLPIPAGWQAALNGDASCDGNVTALDAQIVLSYVVGLPVSQFCVGTIR